MAGDPQMVGDVTSNGVSPIQIMPLPYTNWLWFRVFANLGFKQCGSDHSQQKLLDDIEHPNTFYRGNGWSNDGPDHIHLLQLLYARITGDEDVTRAEEFKAHSQAIAVDLMHYSDPEGRAVPFGRNTVYGFAVTSFWGALAYENVELQEPLTCKVVKGIILKDLRLWQTLIEM
ncbi:hypothetical protein NW765_017609 [Fusarium oxysporum]|nr:hypothetical protein NW765_017609 [Fusarium oxysporum]